METRNSDQLYHLNFIVVIGYHPLLKELSLCSPIIMYSSIIQFLKDEGSHDCSHILIPLLKTVL